MDPAASPPAVSDPRQSPLPASLVPDEPSPPPQALGEPLYRVSTGNYEYRLILRCRQEARARFSQMRKDVLEKMELLDQKHGRGRQASKALPSLGTGRDPRVHISEMGKLRPREVMFLPENPQPGP